jgi:hypothetical protein
VTVAPSGGGNGGATGAEPRGTVAELRERRIMGEVGCDGAVGAGVGYLPPVPALAPDIAGRADGSRPLRQG